MFDWDYVRNGMVQCVVISTGTASQFPKEWLLPSDGRVRVFRPEDAPIAGNKVLAYGHELRAGLFVCSSRKAGLTCRSRLSGHRFFLSRERQRAF